MRCARSDYPPTAGKSAAVHGDLMVIYSAPGTERLEVMYFDNEGHVIEYSVDASRDGKKIVLLSKQATSAPRFRLTYSRIAEGVVDVAFEIVPLGTPAMFKPYVSGRTRRTSH